MGKHVVFMAGLSYFSGVKTSEVETHMLQLYPRIQVSRIFFEGSHLKYFMVETIIFLWSTLKSIY